MVEKIFLTNPYLREIKAKIVKREYKDGNYCLSLNRTIFFPHLSGGQPGDRGSINGIPVLQVYEENNDIIHLVKENISTDKVVLNIDWGNRLDNMQQHTGQHLLSAAFLNLYNAETLGFHIGEDSVYIDVALPDLSLEEAEKIETYVNRIIFSNFQIKSYFLTRDSFKSNSLGKIPSLDSNIRIVEIDGIDSSPCAGTHLRQTGELGIVKIIKWKKYKRNIRLDFLCGNRALGDYKWKNQAIRDISLVLSSRDRDIVDKVNILLKQKIGLEKEVRALKKELNDKIEK